MLLPEQAGPTGSAEDPAETLLDSSATLIPRTISKAAQTREALK